MANLNIIHQALSLEPLRGENMEQYYVDLFNARGDNPVKSLRRRLNADPRGKLQILFSGYRGCGKSTELNKLKTEIENDFIVLSFSILQELDPVNINYVELVMLTMEKLFEVAEAKKLSIDPKLLKTIQNWLNTEEIQKVKAVSAELSAEIGAEINASLPWFVKIFANLRLSGNASYSAKKTITEVVERRLSDLISYCNTLINEIKIELFEINKGLVVVIEDLDKLSIDKAEEIFFNHSNILTSLNTHVVFTFPISLRHHPNANIIKANYNEDFELPMVKVTDRAGNQYKNGREALYNLVSKRIETGSFEMPKLLYQFIDLSGGCIRDLFRLIRDAADSALNDNREAITQTDYDKAFKRLKRDYENTIAEKRKDDKVLITTDEYYNTLVDIATNPIKKGNNTAAELDLRQNLCILGYNDEGWCDVHPIVRAILKERNLLNA